MSEELTLKIKKDDLWKYSTFLLLAVLIIGGFVFLTGDNSGKVVNTGTQGAPNAPSQPSQVKVSADDDPFLGDSKAEVEIIEFSDYQCPFCRKFWTETLPSIKSEYIDTGKVKFVYRDFPLDSIHPGATPAAEAAECVRDIAGSDEAYFEMHDKIFQEQNILDGGDPNNGPVRGTASFGASDLKEWAKDLGYEISDCLDSGKFKSEVQKDLSDAKAAGGRGTPYFVIIGSDGEGTPLSGAQPFSAFKQLIDAELNA